MLFQRMLCATSSFSPSASTSATISRASSSETTIGLVTMTCLPARSAALICSKWNGQGEKMAMTSISGRRQQLLILRRGKGHAELLVAASATLLPTS